MAAGDGAAAVACGGGSFEPQPAIVAATANAIATDSDRREVEVDFIQVRSNRGNRGFLIDPFKSREQHALSTRRTSTDNSTPLKKVARTIRAAASVCSIAARLSRRR
jgi:hypothetical protein